MDLPPSLRSLALTSLPTNQLKTKQPLPPSVASDLVAIDLFGGTFVRDIRKNGIIHQISLTIGFDGATWVFSYRSLRALVPCCYYCTSQQEQADVIARVGETSSVPFFTPFPLFHQWVSDRSGYSRLPHLRVKCTLAKDRRGGSLRLSGQLGGFAVSSELSVVSSLVQPGRRVLRHRGSVAGWKGEEGGGWLEEQMPAHLTQPDLFSKVEASELQQNPFEALALDQGPHGFQAQGPHCPCKSSPELWWGYDSDSAPEGI